ncbi:MAG: retropepsin-like aspartic protease [Candidatus Levyibacteriota bacterium]
MPVISYKFHPEIFRDSKTKKLASIYRPYLLIKIGNKNKWSANFIKALVDSGADNNVFPASFATEVGIDYKKGEPRDILGVGGIGGRTYAVFCRIQLENKKIDTMIQFGESIQMPLLGREGFFNYFDYIKFDAKRKFFEIKF